ncbi:MAG: type IV secretory system conjugative DNA transfer family protein [Bacteroidia bacterium]|nr:type IV secretory system conjugative DNA transfer family protein [Bacteroidia bacterium]
MLQFIESIVKALLETLWLVGKVLLDLLADLAAPAPERSLEYNAQFGNLKSIASSREYGFCVDGINSISLQNSYTNAVLIGGTGTGKSTKVIIPSIISMSGASYLIHDPSGELLTACQGALVADGYQIEVIDLLNASRSSGFNPLSRIKTKSDASYIASTLVQSQNKGSSGDRFWSDSAISLITCIISALLKFPPQFRNMANVRHLLIALAGDINSLDILFSKIADRDPELFDSFRAIKNNAEKTLQGIISQANSVVNSLFDSEEIRKVTAFDSIDIRKVRERKTAIFIQNSVMTQEFLGPVTSIIFTQIISELMEKLPTDDQLDFFCLIDEAAAFSMNWPLILSNSRKYRIGSLLALQSYEQLEHQYGPASATTIMANAFAKIYLPNQSLKTCRDLELIMGKFQFEDEEKKQTKVRPLMTADEIRQIDPNEAIMIAGGNPPFRMKMTPWFKGPYKQFVNLPADPRNPEIPFDQIPLLPIPNHFKRL